MAGRIPIKIYQYRIEEDLNSRYKLIKIWDNQVSIFDHYYNGKKGRLIDYTGFKELPDGTFVTREKGGDKLIERIRISKSPYCNMSKSRHSDKPFSIYNLKGEKLATFINSAVYDLMFNRPGYSLNKLNSNSYTQKDLIFKYDEDEKTN